MPYGSIIEKIKEYTLCKLKQLEELPDFEGNIPLDELKNKRYTFLRPLADYIHRMPDLSVLLSKSKDVLDIGAGKGNAISEIGKEYGCNITATGIEVPEDAMCPFVFCGASSLPFEENTFDLVLSVHGISWEPEQKKALDEVVRVLKPNGAALLYIITFSHSIALWFGQTFWNEAGINKDDYKPYEFTTDYQNANANIEIRTIEMQTHVDGHSSVYYIKITKKGDYNR